MGGWRPKDPPYAEHGEGDRAEGVVEGYSQLKGIAGGEVADPSTIRLANGPPPHRCTIGRN